MAPFYLMPNPRNTHLGERRFPFPKSLYAVADTLRVVVGDNPEALVVDFFAGSGTTLHATALLNYEDGGRRRSVVVTNNEVEETLARELYAAGHYPGDHEFERHGIFEAVTRPRCEALVTGLRPDGKPIEGKYRSVVLSDTDADHAVPHYPAPRNEHRPNSVIYCIVPVDS